MSFSLSTLADLLPNWFRRRSSSAETEVTTTGTTTGGGGTETEPVVIYEAANEMEAQVVKGRLESEGIPAMVRTEAAGIIYGLTTGGLGRADVLVPALLAERALALLSDEADDEEAAGDVASSPQEDQA
jgi:hypothetical protein